MMNNMTGKLTQKQKTASEEGTNAEKTAENWLEKRRFTIDYSHEGKKSAKPYDIKASRGKDRWVIDVKTGEEPSIRIVNFEKMLQEKGYNKVGLALVRGRRVYLLEYKKMSLAGIKAWETRRQTKR